MKEKFGADNVDVELIVGSSGVFDVVVDGAKVYSKKETGSFPRYGEIPLAIAMKQAGM